MDPAIVEELTTPIKLNLIFQNTKTIINTYNYKDLRHRPLLPYEINNVVHTLLSDIEDKHRPFLSNVY